MFSVYSNFLMSTERVSKQRWIGSCLLFLFNYRAIRNDSVAERTWGAADQHDGVASCRKHQCIPMQIFLSKFMQLSAGQISSCNNWMFVLKPGSIHGLSSPFGFRNCDISLN